MKISIFVFLIFSWSSSLGQSKSIGQYIQEIELNSSFIFNYNVECADTIHLEYEFQEEYSLEKINEFFYHSPIDIEVKSNQIVLLPLEKKSFTICGSVNSSIDNETFPFAGITIGKGQGGQTNENGKFKLTILAYKNDSVRFSYLGYNPKILMVQELIDCQDIHLELNEDLINTEIIIRDYISRFITEGNSYGSFVFNFGKASGKSDISQQDVLQKVQLLPGIHSPDDSATNINIRGSTADHNLISWEGVTLYDGGHFFGMTSSINPFHLKEIKVHKSIHDPTYENRIGGIVEMNLVDTIVGPIALSIGSNLTEAHLNISAPFFNNKLRVILAGRRSLIDLFEESPTLEAYALKTFQGTVVLEDEQEESMEQELSLTYGDINAKLILQPNSSWKLQSSFLYSLDEFNYSSTNISDIFENNNTLDSKTVAFSNKLEYKHDPNNTTSAQLNYSNYISASKFEITELSTALDFIEEELNNNISDFTFKLDHNKIIDFHSIRFGYVYDKKILENFYSKESDYEYLKQSETFTQGKFHHLFANDAIKLPKWHLDFGARLSYAVAQSNLRVSPRYSVRYKPIPNLTLKTGGGIFYQYIRQLYQTGGSQFNLSNTFYTLPSTKDETPLNSKKLTLGAVYKKRNWLIDIEGYYHHTAGLSAENPSIKNEFILNDMGELISTGVDILISKRIKQFQSALYYSVSNQIVTFPFFNEDEKEYFPANTDQRHVFNFTNNYTFRQFTAQCVYQYRTGLPYTNGKDVRLIMDNEPGENYEVELEGINERRLKDYHRVDMALNYNYNWKKTNFDVGVSMLNILNRKNLQSRQFSLVNINDSTSEPEILNTEKHQLLRTLILNFRVYF